MAEQARKNGLVWLEGYEAMLKDFLDFEEKAAEGTGAEWATTLAHAHANFVRSTSEVMLGAMRQQLSLGGWCRTAASGVWPARLTVHGVPGFAEIGTGGGSAEPA